MTLINSVKMQMAVLMQRKSAVIVYFGMMLLVLANFFENISRYYGKDLMEMVHPMKLVLLSDYSSFGFYLMQYYPLLVVIPAAFSYIADRNSKELVFLQSRVGAKNYYFGKMIAVFLVTFMVFTIPLLVELMLNCIAFPIAATGDQSNMNLYDQSYIFLVRRYLFSSFFVQNPYLYTGFLTIVFGLVSGVLAVFCLAFSTFKFMKYKILAFLPIYIFLYLLKIVKDSFSQISVSANYFEYLRLFTSYPKSELGYVGLILIILCISILIITIKSRKDTLE